MADREAVQTFTLPGQSGHRGCAERAQHETLSSYIEREREIVYVYVCLKEMGEIQRERTKKGEVFGVKLLWILSP